MTNEERNLLINTAAAVTALSEALSQGASLYDLREQFERINNSLGPLAAIVDRQASGFYDRPLMKPMVWSKE